MKIAPASPAIANRRHASAAQCDHVTGFGARREIESHAFIVEVLKLHARPQNRIKKPYVYAGDQVVFAALKAIIGLRLHNDQ
jgi:hypothetical protein